MSVKNHSEETKLKMSAAQKARHAKMSDEQKKAISEKIKKKWREIHNAMYLLQFENDQKKNKITFCKWCKGYLNQSTTIYINSCKGW